MHLITQGGTMWKPFISACVDCTVMMLFLALSATLIVLLGG